MLETKVRLTDRCLSQPAPKGRRKPTPAMQVRAAQRAQELASALGETLEEG